MTSPEQFSDDLDRELQELLEAANPQLPEFDIDGSTDMAQDYLDLLRMAYEHTIALPEALRDPSATASPEAAKESCLDIDMLEQLEDSEFRLVHSMHELVIAQGIARNEGFNHPKAVKYRDDALIRFITLDSAPIQDKVGLVTLANDYLETAMDPVQLQLEGSYNEVTKALEHYVAACIFKDLKKDHNHTSLEQSTSILEHRLHQQLGAHDDLPAFCKGICDYAKMAIGPLGNNNVILEELFKTHGLDKSEEKFGLSQHTVYCLIDETVQRLKDFGYDASLEG